MERSAVSLILYLLSLTGLHAQDLKSRKVKKNGYKEEFSVLKSDKSIKHGEYKKIYRSGNLIIEGQFVNNNKVGEWRYYYKNQLEQVYNYDDSQLVEFNDSNLEFEVLQGTEFKKQSIEQPPLFIGGRAGLTEKLNDIISYPEQALRMGVEGRMFIYVTIGDDNNLIDVSITKGINEFNQVALDGFNKLKEGWLSGIQNGNKTTSRLIIPILFILDPNGDKTISIE